MGKFAAETSVSSDASIAEMQQTLRRYGADAFMHGWTKDSASVAFEVAGRRVQFIIPMPDRQDREYTHTEKGRVRSASSAASAYEQAIRQRWRALSLVVKAKLEAVDSGIETFEEAFLAHLVIPGRGTVGSVVLPELSQALETGRLPPLLPSPGR